MEPLITVLGHLGYNMDIEKEYRLYIIEQRIKSLNGKKQLILEGTPMDSYTKEDIDSQIQVLTNMLKML
jgi:hypothetical protein